MKRAIFKNFIIIISLALLLSGSIFSTLISNILLGKTRENMIDLLQIIDQSLDYSEDIKSQIDNLLAINQRNKSRITVMDIMGNVVADSDISDYNNIDNHLNREEIQEALKAGIGYAKRKSNTLGIPMLYVSYLSRQGNYILRISMPYSGLINYMVYLLPAILLSLGISLIVSIILGNRFSRSITKPLYEISEELLKINEDNSNLSFRNYEYYELNLIANTTKQMANAIGNL